MSDTQSWDDFCAEVFGQERTETIEGVTVTVPSDVDPAIMERITELQDSSAIEDVREILALLFGVDAAEQWRESRMGLQRLQVVLVWGLAHAQGREITFREAHEIVQDPAGNVLGPTNRAARRAAPKPQSAATGGPSKRTSKGSTGSARKTSRA